MDDMIQFLAVMGALSASSTTMTHQLKKRFRMLQFEDVPTTLGTQDDSALFEFKRGKFHANVHLVCGINGFILALLGDIHPLSFLGLTPIWANIEISWVVNLIDYLTAGVLVAYGGPWFHEVLGILREYKKSLRGNR